LPKVTANTFGDRLHDQTLTDLDETADLPFLADVSAHTPRSAVKAPSSDDAAAIDLLRQLLDLARSIDTRLEAISQALVNKKK